MSEIQRKGPEASMETLRSRMFALTRDIASGKVDAKKGISRLSLALTLKDYLPADQVLNVLDESETVRKSLVTHFAAGNRNIPELPASIRDQREKERAESEAASAEARNQLNAVGSRGETLVNELHTLLDEIGDGELVDRLEGTFGNLADTILSQGIAISDLALGIALGRMRMPYGSRVAIVDKKTDVTHEIIEHMKEASGSEDRE